MRGLPGVVQGIEQSLPIFHANGIYPAVNLGINRRIGGEAVDQAFRSPLDSREQEQAFVRFFEGILSEVLSLCH